jgi:hypothetical protein
VELITSTTTGKGKREIACHRSITSLRTNPEALLRLIRQRWSIENEWHWVRDTQLGEDAHRYTHRTGAAVFSFLRTVVMNLLRCSGYRSIYQGLRELAHDFKAKGLWRWEVQFAQANTRLLKTSLVYGVIESILIWNVASIRCLRAKLS